MSAAHSEMRHRHLATCHLLAGAGRWPLAAGHCWLAVGLVRVFSPPDIDLELARQRLESVELIMVRGTEDRALSSQLKQEEDERLREGGIDYRTISYPGGHDIDEQTLLTLATSGST